MQLSEGRRGEEAVMAIEPFRSVLSQALRAPLFAARISCAIWTYRRDNTLGVSEGNQVLAAPTWRSGQPEQHPLARVSGSERSSVEQTGCQLTRRHNGL